MSAGACKTYYCDMQSRLKPLKLGRGFSDDAAAEDIVRTAANQMAPDIGASWEGNRSGNGRDSAETFWKILEEPYGTWGERKTQWVIDYLGTFTEPAL